MTDATMAATVAPTSAAERIGELDIIRGFALFGVLWINMFGYTSYIVSEEPMVHLFGEAVDGWVGLFSEWVMAGKAQALFSMLFGFGFAILSDRAEARGVNAGGLYLRRILILLVVGWAHLLLLWGGDILHAYAMMALVLMLTRRWPAKWLLALGVVLSLGATVAGHFWLAAITPAGQEPAVLKLMEAGMEARWAVFLGHDYLAYVRALLTMAGPEFYFSPFGYILLGTILGRFLVGAWLYRQGWLQDMQTYAVGFRRALPWLLGGGLAIAAVDPLMTVLNYEFIPGLRWLTTLIVQASQLVLALGYGCLLVVLCQSPRWKARLGGLGAVGQMALTNYLVQSLFYMFVLNGFGLGWLRYAGPTFCLIAAVGFFTVQILFSLWWLARFRFGPAEWLWRSATYGRWQPLRA